MRTCKIIHRNNPSDGNRQITKLLVDKLMKIDIPIMDKDCRNTIRTIRSGTYMPNYKHTALRIDLVYDDHIGITSSMGTTATISRRILSAFHYYHTKMISEVIFVAHSEANAWYQNNCKKNKKENTNGNRATSKALLDLIDEISKSISIPLTVIEVTENEALEAYNAHFS